MSVERELSEKQRPDGDLSDHDDEIQAYEEAERIEEQFNAIVESTIDDTTAKATVERIYTAPTNNSMVIDVNIPGEEDAETFRMSKPKLASERYSFVRWLRKYDYSLGDFSGMVENSVEVEVEESNNGYSLVFPEYDARSRTEKATEYAGTLWEAMGGISAGVWAICILSGAWIGLMTAFGAWIGGPYIIESAIVILWQMFFICLFGLVGAMLADLM